VAVAGVGPSTLELREVRRSPTSRFANQPVRLPDGLHRDILGLYRETLRGGL
jgi:rhamnulokinase